jgi:hypothetical protein
VFWRRFIIAGGAVAAIAAAILFHFGTAEAATNPCGGSTFGSSNIKTASGSVIGQLVVYKLTNNRVTNTYCVVTYHRGATYGVKLSTRIASGGPDGKGYVDVENVKSYAGPFKRNFDTGCSTCTGWVYFAGEIIYKGHLYSSGAVTIRA